MKMYRYYLSFILLLMLFSFISARAQTSPAGENRHTFLCADYTHGIVCIISDEWENSKAVSGGAMQRFMGFA
jgi:hypothetical protein